MRMMKAFLAAAVLAMIGTTAQAQDKQVFPSVEDLKTKVGFDEEQAKKAEPICADYTTKLKDAMAKAKDAADKKAAFAEIRTLKTEGMGKLKELCKDDEQKKKLDEAFPARKKKE